MSFDGDEENVLLSILMYLQLTSTYSYNGYPKLKSIFGFWSHRQTMFWVVLQEQHYKLVLLPTLNFKD